MIDDILRTEPYAVPEGQSAALPKATLRFYRWHDRPYMPVEFSVAAYRFGHSIIRPSYLINDVARAEPPVQGASRIPLFSDADGERQSLRGFRTLPEAWGVQWKFFLPRIGGGPTPNLPQPSYKLDAQLSHPLGAMHSSAAGAEELVAGFDPNIARNLAVRNLLRGLHLGLPSGQEVARAMGIEPLTDEQLFQGVDIPADAAEDLAGHAPLWFYVLKEAEILAGSAHLGPVGGRIVAEVLIGLLAGDPLSYLGVAPSWTPTLGPTPGTFSLSDLINIAIPAPDAPTPPHYG